MFTPTHIQIIFFDKPYGYAPIEKYHAWLNGDITDGELLDSCIERLPRRMRHIDQNTTEFSGIREKEFNAWPNN